MFLFFSAFRFGDSDTDDDIDVPQAASTGNNAQQNNEVDDFEFYS